ncbi:MAG TPA: hypothetical protein VHP11_11550 [Tepidisphaeraceae bacterium]|nr:hypothetical protein [Tepidisphaeraceae bacterium]
MSTNLRASEPDDVRALVKAILDSDQQIQDFQLHVLIRINGEPFDDVDWGYDRGKEFFSGTLYTYDKNMVEDRRHFEIQAFDGERMYSFTDQLVNGKSWRNGDIGNIRNNVFRACPNPRTLLGSDVGSQTRETMGEVISRFANVKLRPEPEMVAGHKCRVLELVGVDPYPEGVVYDALVWIDTERGYRPLRYEKYNNRGEFVRWKLLHDRVDNVQLAQIDGIWFPVYGEVQQWGWDYEAAPGFSREDCLREMKSVEDGFAKKMLVVKLDPSCLFTVHVDPATIRLNKGVPAERFSIDFPDRTAVHDVLRGIDYVVGRPIR